MSIPYFFFFRPRAVPGLSGRSLLAPNEYSPESLQADLPLRRAAKNLLVMQLTALQEGLANTQNPFLSPAQGNPLNQYIVGDFETLPIISSRLYGSPDRWNEIAIANGLEYPYTVVPGQVLEFPN